MKIKFVVIAVKWFDKANGNTYHSIRAFRCSDGAVITAPLQYGYGRQYEQTALNAMNRAGWLPEEYKDDGLYRYERDNNYPILWSVTDGLKRDCVENGKL